MTRPDPYTEWKKREASALLRVANSARRSAATHTPASARRAVARLFPPPYSRLEILGLKLAEEEDRLEMAGLDYTDWLEEHGWSAEEHQA